MERVYNFAAGPSTMPLEALEIAQKELTNYRGTGMSVMEMSHRSKMYIEIFDSVVALVKELLCVPDDYAILFLHGGATAQFASFPMNLMTKNGRADYVDSGSFAHGAMVEAQKYGAVHCVASSKDVNYVRVPDIDPKDFDPQADYFYITTNNTIYGTRYTELPKTGNVPLVADMSSNILSETYDVRDFGVLYAGAQKNIGPAGFVLMVARRDLLGRAMANTPKIYDWALMEKNGSMLNTPSTYSIYLAGLCLEWLKRQGGVKAIEKINIEKAQLLYDCIDDSSIFTGVAEKKYRSRMNVTYRAKDAEMDAAFVKEAAAQGLLNIKGHRSVGGIRASIYNAMPVEGVQALVKCMRDFEAKVLTGRA